MKKMLLLLVTLGCLSVCKPAPAPAADTIPVVMTYERVKPSYDRFREADMWFLLWYFGWLD